jgi:hypothetical protein
MWSAPGGCAEQAPVALGIASDAGNARDSCNAFDAFTSCDPCFACDV